MPVVVLEIQQKAVRNSVCYKCTFVAVAAPHANHASAVFLYILCSVQRFLHISMILKILIPDSIHQRPSISPCFSRRAAVKAVQIGLNMRSRCVWRAVPVLIRVGALQTNEILH